MTLQFLDPTTISMAEIFLSVLTERLDQEGDIWGEKPRLHMTGISFRRLEPENLVIPVVETFVVLGGLYKNGNYYKVTPLTELPGKYDYQHKLCFYSLNPSTYRKICEQRIRDALSKIILHQRDYLPERMCGITVQQTNIAHEVSLQTSGSNPFAMLIVIIPAIEGGGVPEGCRPGLARHIESQRNHPAWFLVPCSRRPSELQTWSVTFEPLEGALLQRAPLLHQTILFLTWFAEKRGWGRLGFSALNVFIALVFAQLQATAAAFACEKFTVQINCLLNKLRLCLLDGQAEDFFVPKKNLLDILSCEGLESLKSEIENVIENLFPSSQAVEDYIHSNYPYYFPRGDEEINAADRLALEEFFPKRSSNIPLSITQGSEGHLDPELQSGSDSETSQNGTYSYHYILVEEANDDSGISRASDNSIARSDIDRVSPISNSQHYLDRLESASVSDSDSVMNQTIICNTALTTHYPSTQELSLPNNIPSGNISQPDLLLDEYMVNENVQDIQQILSLPGEHMSEEMLTRRMVQENRSAPTYGDEIPLGNMHDRSRLLIEAAKENKETNNNTIKDLNRQFIGQDDGSRAQVVEDSSANVMLRKRGSQISKHSGLANGTAKLANGSACVMNGGVVTSPVDETRAMDGVQTENGEEITSPADAAVAGDRPAGMLEAEEVAVQSPWRLTFVVLMFIIMTLALVRFMEPDLDSTFSSEKSGGGKEVTD